MRSSKLNPSWILLSLVALYALAHLLWYLKTPLGISPVLDGQENLILARKIANGTLEAEPFFRAILYPAILAFFPFGHSLLGFLCHLANTALAISLSRRLWRNENAGLLAGALVGFNPVLLHFAFDPIDTTLAITFFLASLAALQKSVNTPTFDSQGATLAAVSGLTIALASLTRPHFLLTLLVLAGITIAATLRKKLSFARLAAYLAALALPLLAMGFVQQSISGSFRILPWQGAYNLYVSNNAKANGLYYRQTLSFQNRGEHQNPARLEEETLYQQEHGNLGSIAERASYWRSQTFAAIAESPIHWLKLEAFKLYASLNSFEQYNNKTYSFHKRLSPWLRYNPLNWGILLTLASFCAATLWIQMRRDLTPLLLVAASLLAGLLIFMASARFRLPLVPLLAVVAGGLPLAWAAFKNSSWKTRRRALFTASIAATVSFSQFASIASEKTYLQDALLLSDAAARIGQDALAIQWANDALEREPLQQQALRLRLISRYNQIASGEIPNTPKVWSNLRSDSQTFHSEDELLAFIRGVISWNSQDRDRAIEQWKNGYTTYGLNATTCLAALEYVDAPISSVPLPAPLETFLANGQHWLYATAIANRLPSKDRPAFLQSITLPEPAYQNISQSLARILPQK